MIALLAALLVSLAGLTIAFAGQRKLRATTLGPDAGGAWRSFLSPVATRLRPQGEALDQVLSLLQQAGKDAAALDRFLEDRALGLLLGVGGSAAAALLLDDEVGLVLGLALLAGGVILPKRRLETAASERRSAIAASLPSAVDLLMTSVDAGLSIEQAISRVGKELDGSWPVLARELSLTAKECEASVPLGEALRRLARRVELEDLSALCGVISQAHELGAPIVRTLAEYTDTTRKLRMAQLEEHAGKLATKLTLPLAVFLLPAALVFMLGAAGIQLLKVLE